MESSSTGVGVVGSPKVGYAIWVILKRWEMIRRAVCRNSSSPRHTDGVDAQGYGPTMIESLPRMGVPSKVCPSNTASVSSSNKSSSSL